MFNIIRQVSIKNRLTVFKQQQKQKNSEKIKFMIFMIILMFQIQKLSRENKQLKDKLRSLNSDLRILRNEYEIQKSVIQKAKQHNNHLSLELKQIKRREQQKKVQKQQMENRYYNVLKRLEDQIEQRKAKYRKLQAKINPLMDHDSVRLQILNQVEGVHNLEIEQLKIKINQLKDQVLRLKRQNYRLQHKIQQDKIDSQNQIRKIKNLTQNQQNDKHLNALTFQMCNEVENKLLANYKQARKQAEYYKQKYFNTQKRSLQKISNLEQEIGFLKEKNQFYDRKANNS